MEVLVKNKINAFVFDFDGTLKSSSEPECNPVDLINKIVENKKSVGIITASGVSALMGIGSQLKKAYLGVANGMALYKISELGMEEVYRYPINDVDKVLRVWQKVVEEIAVDESGLMEKGLRTFKEFLIKDWGVHISKDLIEKAKPFEGKCFIEELKVTVVMPKNEVYSQSVFVGLMQKYLGDKYIIEMGDNTFAHITSYLGMVPKLMALKRIQKELELSNDEIVTFGDMPDGNDRGLLIDCKFPYTFTNRRIGGLPTPPFILEGCESGPVASVYKAVLDIIS